MIPRAAIRASIAAALLTLGGFGVAQAQVCPTLSSIPTYVAAAVCAGGPCLCGVANGAAGTWGTAGTWTPNTSCENGGVTGSQSNCSDQYQMGTGNPARSGNGFDGNTYAPAGGMVAPPPPGVAAAFGVNCNTPFACSAGIRHNNLSTSVLYDNYPNLCRFVDNTSGHDIFVPQNTPQEFVDFLNNLPGSVTAWPCALGNTAYPLTATASYPNAFLIVPPTANGISAGAIAPGSDIVTVAGAEPLTLSLTANVPTARASPPTTFTIPAAAMSVPAIFNPTGESGTYMRYDCQAGATAASATNPAICNPRVITEQQMFSVTTAASSCSASTKASTSTNCDGSWPPTATNPPTVVSDIFTIGGYTPVGCSGATCGLADYEPPMSGQCGTAPTAGSSAGACVAPTTLAAGSVLITSTLTTWTCNGVNGGGNTPCSSVDGSCGTANGQSFSASAPPPGAYTLCSSGTPTAVAGSGPWNWSCDGSANGGAIVPCSALLTPTPPPACGAVNGACGGVVNAPCMSGSCVGNCAVGIVAAMTDNGVTTTWTCDGLNGGTAISCSGSDPAIGGVCSAAADTCTAGTAAGYSASAGTWTCDGLNGGSNASCTVAIAGVCSATADTCNAGTAAGYSASAGTWTCDGLNGGSNASCTVAINGACSSTADTCTAGTAAGYSASAGTWTCDGLNGGSNASCAALVNGGCGSTQYSCNSGTVDLNNEFDNGLTSMWICDSTNGGTNSGVCSSADVISDPCNSLADECYSPWTPQDYSDSGGTNSWECVNGSASTACGTSGGSIAPTCNSSTGTTQGAPSLGGCTVGTYQLGTAYGAGTTMYWTCGGVGNDSTVQCSNSGYLCGTTAGTCTWGDASGLTDNGTTTSWSCSQVSGLSQSCSLPDLVTAVCGSTTNTCTAGTPASGGASCSDNGTTTTCTWTCLANGVHGGTNASCSSSTPDPVNGSCGSAVDTCNSGTPTGLSGGPTTFNWECDGSNGGSSASCSN